MASHHQSIELDRGSEWCGVTRASSGHVASHITSPSVAWPPAPQKELPVCAKARGCHGSFSKKASPARARRKAQNSGGASSG